MNIDIKLFATLTKYLPEDAKGKHATLSIQEGITIGGVFEQMGVQPGIARLILVNGTHQKLDYVLKERDLLSVFPAIAGG